MPPNDAPVARSVEFTPEFQRNVQALRKKYRHIRSDLELVIRSLQAGQTPGDQIPRTSYAVFKVRVRNSDLQKGKSSGYRLIYWVREPPSIVLVTIYSKTEQGDVSAEQIRRALREFKQ